VILVPPEQPKKRPARRRQGPRDVVLHAHLAHIEPTIWRRVQVPEEYTLHQLHRVLQFIFGWLDYHLYSFRVGDRRFEAPHPEAEGESATRVRLRQLKLEEGSELKYVYDFGDSWRHVIRVEAIDDLVPDDDRLPRLLGGERAAPPEDSGGPWGYADKLEALRDRKHPQHKEIREWIGPLFDPERFDPWLAGQNLTLAAASGAI
jgi:hypothetical protein